MQLFLKCCARDTLCWKAVIHVSHSYVGIIARAFAAKYPGTVSAMLLVDPASEHDLDIMRSIDLEKAVEEVMMLKKHDITLGK